MTTESRAVSSQMRQYMKNILRIGPNTFSQLFCGSGFTDRFEKFGQMALQLQQPASRLFSSLHARLMVRIDVNQRSVKADGALIQSDQSTHRKWRYSINANGNRFPIPFEKGRARPAQKSLKENPTVTPSPT